MALPPWLQVTPQDFVRAASAGAEAGLGVARLNQSAEQAAANRSLQAWEAQQRMEMQAEAAQAERERTAQEMSARMAQEMATLGLTKSAQEETARYHTGELAQRELAAAGLDQYRQDRLAIDRDTGTRLGQQADTAATKERRLGTQDPFTLADFRAELAHNKALRTQLAKLPVITETTTDSDSNIAQKSALLGELSQSQQRLQKLHPAVPSPMASGAGPSLAPPPAAAPPASADTFLVAPKDPAQRKKDQAYRGPKGGLYTWTGTGWIPYESPSHDETPVPEPDDTKE